MRQSFADISCATASGKSLEELSRLVALRAQRLGELTKDAVVAAAIDVLVSLRADTRDARGGDGNYIPKSVTPRPDLYVSFRDGPAHIPCLRVGSRRGPRFTGGGSFYLADKGAKASDLKVFRIVSRHENVNPYFVAARSVSDALKIERRRAKWRIKKKGGLAKTALGVAMAKLSTRNVADTSPKLARILASRLSHATVSYGSGTAGAPGTFCLEYRDDLHYAIPALKSGAGGVDIAVRKAANKIAGMITHAAHKAGDIEHDIPTPFPEVKRRK